MSSTNNIPPGWHPDPANPSGGMRWWDGNQWTEQVQPFANQPPPPSLPGSPAAGGYPAAGHPGSYPAGGPVGGPMGGGPFGRGRGGRRGGPFGGFPSSVGGSFWSRNRQSVTAIIISAIYIGIALATGFVLLGIVPLFASIRAVRFREQLAPLAVLAAIVTIVVSVTAITSR